MDALMASLVAALLITIADRPAMLVAVSPSPGRALAIALLTTTAMAIVSVALGTTLAPRLAPAATNLMLAMALALVGLEFLLRRLPPAPRGGIAGAVIGSGLWFVVLTLAMRSALPWLAAPGAILGVMTALGGAAATREGWARLPLTALRRTIGALFAALAAVLACAAIGIV